MKQNNINPVFRYKEPLTIFNKEEMILWTYKVLQNPDFQRYKNRKFDIRRFYNQLILNLLEIHPDIAMKFISKGLTEIHSSSKIINY